MKGWKEVNIGSLGEVVTGNTPLTSDREFYGGTYPFIKPTDMDVDRRRVTSWEENYSEKAFKKYKNSYIPAGSTGVVTIGTVGEKLFQADRNCFTNQSVNVVIPYKEYYDEDFVYYLLKYNLPKVSAANPGTASGRHHVSKSNFCAITVSVPKEKTVQTKIGAILSGFDNLIENNLKRIKLLEEIAQRTYEEWFVKFRINGEELPIDEETGLPDGWEIKSLKEVAQINEKSINKKFEGRLKYVDISSVSTGRIDSYTEYNIEDAPGRARRIVRHGDIIWSCVRPNRKSYSIIWNPEENLIASTGFAVITPKKLPSSYLYCFVTTELYVGYLTSHAGGAAYPAVTSDTFAESTVVVPERELVNRFDQKIRPSIDLSSKLAKQNIFLREVRDMLLPRLMSGKIDVEKVNVAGIAFKNPSRDAKTIAFYPMKEKKETLVAEATDVYKTRQENDKWQFKEAVLIAVLTHKFGSVKYPLGRKRYTKLSYLFHRHAADQIAKYARKAAGPYNPGTKYGGPEKIAQQNKYIVKHTNGKLEGFVASDCIADAYPYFQNYWSMDYLNWMDQFRYKKNDELELYATVDNAMIELHAKGQQVNVEAIKSIIKSEKEWAAKLEREIFSDANIQSAMFYLPTLFTY